MEYFDFILQLRSAGGQKLRVSVPSSPAGEFEERLLPSELPRDWSRESPGYVLRDFRPRQTAARHRIEPQEIGAQLFSTIFPIAIRVLYERSLEAARTEGKGLRLKILLNPRDSAVRFLQGLPWELLFHEDISSKFLALSRDTPVVRALFVPQTPRSARFSKPLRVLAAQSLPPGAPVLDLQRELSEMASARERGAIEIVPWKARLSDLRETLDRHAPIDVLHFMGHADFLPDQQEGALLFEKNGGGREIVLASNLAKKLSDFRSLQLVVLNACKTAQSPSSASGNPFGGVAAALVQAGFPLVLAMQEVILDDSAIALSRALYRTLAGGQPIEVAVAEARQAVFDLNPAGLDWAIPCLYLRTSTTRQSGPQRLPPEEDVADILQAGIEAFQSGNYSLARQQFAETLKRDSGSVKAQLFDTLARMAAGAPLPMNTALEIDATLQKLLTTADPDIVNLARLALGLLRHDVIEPRYLRPQGISSSHLFAELDRRGQPKAIEKKVAQALGASRDALIRFKLQT
jgi:hypothetical protein